MSRVNQEIIKKTILGIDTWLDSMRNEKGYCGPVAHRWRDCLLYTGPGLDWRYEGIIKGYLHLYETTGESIWLAKAKRAGNDLVNGQDQVGNYLPSSFETNPAKGGTPHEAACDLGLINLASILRDEGDKDWGIFANTAERNLRIYYIEQLWDDESLAFHNLPRDPSFVPNKVATNIEALFAYMFFSGDQTIFDHYIFPSLHSIISCQVTDQDKPNFGAIDQSSLRGKPSGRYFPYYVSRCIPALVAAYQFTNDKKYLQSANWAMEFIVRCQQVDGSFPQVVYRNQRKTLGPQWIAGVGDILKAASLLIPYGLEWPLIGKTETWMLEGVLPSGGIKTGRGFAWLEGKSLKNASPDFRDLLPVCGWVDKVFHYLANCLTEKFLNEPTQSKETTLDCLYWGEKALYRETSISIEVVQDDTVRYRWQKGESWAHIS